MVRSNKRTKRTKRARARKTHRKQRGGDLAADALTALASKYPDVKHADTAKANKALEDVLFDEIEGIDGKNDTIVVGDYTFQKVRPRIKYYTLVAWKTIKPTETVELYSYLDS